MKAYNPWMGCSVVSLHPGEDDVRFDRNGFLEPVFGTFSPLHLFISSPCICPTSYPNPMKQTAARYFPFSFVLRIQLSWTPSFRPVFFTPCGEVPAMLFPAMYPAEDQDLSAYAALFQDSESFFLFSSPPFDRPSLSLSPSRDEVRAVLRGVNRSSTFPSWT